jgi:hypothetical protein
MYGAIGRPSIPPERLLKAPRTADCQFQCLGDLVSVEAHRNLDELYENLGAMMHCTM